MTDTNLEKLALLRKPFPDNQISKLPKETKAQADDRRADMKNGIKCQVCGGWHHRNAVHLDYVGHAALTDRLLDVDPLWSWEPAALRDGLPAFDQTGGLWIKLTVCGVTRLGYGHAAAKPQMDPGSREKEVIGDALRNAGMRFGMALDLWHKGDLHAHVEDEGAITASDRFYNEAEMALSSSTSLDQLKAVFVAKTNKAAREILSESQVAQLTEIKDKKKADLERIAQFDEAA